MASGAERADGFAHPMQRSDRASPGALDFRDKLLEIIPAGIYSCDAEGGITSFNRMAADLWGRAPEIGEPDERFCGSYRLYRLDGTPLPHSETPMALALREGRGFEDAEVVIERPDGSRFTALVNIAVDSDERGRVTGAVNCFVDITERKRAESDLRQRTQAYYRLLEHLPAGAYTCDAEGLITYYNQRAVEIWGREPKLNDAEHRFCGSFRLFRPDGAPIRHDQCWMALALQREEEYSNREIRIERPDGSVATVLAHAHPLHDEKGRLTGAANVLVDITDRKRSEDLLDGQNRLLEMIATGVPAAEVLAALSRLIEEQSGGRLRGTIAYGEESVAGPRVVARGRRGDAGPDGDRSRGSRPGRSTPVVGSDDEILGALEWYRTEPDDAGPPTERLIEDERLIDIATHVAGIALERERVIAERKRDKEALLAADRRKDEFLAMLSHELRNPLAPIRNAVELLHLEQGDGTIRKRALDILDRQVGTLTRLVDDLLDVSRVTTGTIRLRRTEVDLNAVLRGTIDSVRPLFEARRQELSVSVPEEPLRVEGDATRLEQVLVNLLTNAAKYTPEGGRILLDARRQPRNDGNGEAVIRVKDDGVGMEPGLLSEAFELFRKGEDGDHTQTGLGIGLSLVKRLTEMHGGSVRAGSDGPGRGSVFTVRLPLMASPGAEEGPGSASGDGPRLADPPTGDASRVLVVDDNRDAAEMLVRLLRGRGYEVRTAHDGPAALRAAAEFAPEVVLLDIGMPEMDGFEVARRLRAQPGAGRDALLVAMTGYGQSADKRRSREAGFDHHLVKPADFGELLSILDLIGEPPEPSDVPAR